MSNIRVALTNNNKIQIIIEPKCRFSDEQHENGSAILKIEKRSTIANVSHSLCKHNGNPTSCQIKNRMINKRMKSLVASQFTEYMVVDTKLSIVGCIYFVQTLHPICKHIYDIFFQSIMAKAYNFLT